MSYSTGYGDYGMDLSKGMEAISSTVTGKELPKDLTSAVSAAGDVAKALTAHPPPPPKKPLPVKTIVIGLAVIGVIAYLAKTKLPEATR